MLKHYEIALQIYEQIKADTQKLDSVVYGTTEGYNRIFMALLESILDRIRDEVVNM